MLRVGPLLFAAILFSAGAALAGEPMAPDEIKSAFFTGQPFTAVSLSGAKFKMIFTPDGGTTCQSLTIRHCERRHRKLSAKGFCTAWNKAKPNCFTIIPSGENKWSVQKIATTIATTVAVWSK